MNSGKHLTLALLACLVSGYVLAQVSRTEGMIDLSNDMSHTLVKEIPFEPITDKGSHFFFDDWHSGLIELENGIFIKTDAIKYDLENNRFEIKTKNAVKLLDGDKVKQYQLDKDQGQLNFINAEYFTINNVPMYGFFQILSDGITKLLVRTTVGVKQANYNVAIDMGSKQNEIIKTETLYLFINNQLNEIKKNKKKILKLFGLKATEIERFSKSEKLSFKVKNDLVKIVNYYNTI